MMLGSCATFCGWEKQLLVIIVSPNRLGGEGAKE